MGSILFMTPMYGGMCHERYFHSCMALTFQLQQMGVEHTWLTGRNESLIHRGRMEMTLSFLNSEHTHMMWIDADMDFTVDDVGRVWNLASKSDDVIGVGLYAMKRDDMPLSAWKDGKLVRLEDCPDHPFEVDYAGTGFMMMSKVAVQKLAGTVESYEGPHGRVPALYMTPIFNDCLESEDYHFCRLARENGMKIMADPGVKLGHWGQARYAAQ